MKNQKILFITTKQPSTNPRMRKAAETLARNGHHVHVLFAHGVDWAAETDEAIFATSPCTWQQVGGDPKHNALSYFLSRGVRKIWELLGNVRRSHCRSYGAYLREGLKWKPDLVIGHNPGALGPVTELGKRLHIPTLFDAEDYHRGEPDPKIQPREAKSVAKLENACIPQLTAATGASPLIVKSYEQLFPEISWSTINNAFPSALLQANPKPHTGPLKIVWFSQVVGLDRGLVEFLNGMALKPEIPINLTLIGTASEELKSTLISEVSSNQHRIQFKDPCSEFALFKEISQHEIGLAIEVPKTKNRALCRTNKLYTYPLCGVWMLVSKTKAQLEFIEEFPDAGEIIDLDLPESVAAALKEAHSDRAALLEKRIAARELGKTKLNWEREENALLDLVNHTLSK